MAYGVDAAQAAAAEMGLDVGFGEMGFADGGNAATMGDAPTDAVEALAQEISQQNANVFGQNLSPQQQAMVMTEAVANQTSLANTIDSLFGTGLANTSRNQAIAMMNMPNAAVASGGGITAPAGLGSLSMNRGMLTYSGMPDPNYSGFGQSLVRGMPDMQQGEADNIVPPVVNAMGQQQCPEGYEYDFNLNACRKITPTPAEQLQYVEAATPETPRYARMGLLDTPPSGLLEVGFGSPTDFTAQNLAFRRQSASVPSYFSDPRTYEGYTLI